MRKRGELENKIQNGALLTLRYVKRDQTYISGLLLEYWTLDSQSIQGERVNSNRKVWRSKKSDKEGIKDLLLVCSNGGRKITLLLLVGARKHNAYFGKSSKGV
jgi:hypothetical protein